VEFLDAVIDEFDRKIDFIGISFAGQVNSGTIISAPNLEIKHFDIKNYIKEKYNIRLEIENDLKCASLAEYSKRDHSKMLSVLYIGTGIGSSSVENGKLITGSTNLAGEIGHIPYRKAPFPCGCGKDNCLELFTSKIAIIKWLQYYNVMDTNITLDSLRKGECEYSKDILENYLEGLLNASAILITMFNPDHLVLGGWMIRKNSWLVDYVKENIHKTAFAESCKSVIIELSNLDDGSIEGAKLLENYYNKD
jgi:glucokinase